MTSLNSPAMLRAIEEELQRLRTIRGLLAGEPAWPAVRDSRSGKRILSAEARQRIVDAQKRRWASHKANA